MIYLWLFQAMVTRFSSIATRKLSNALKILTFDKCMVATSDYNDFHKTIKRHILSNVLGANAQVTYFPISLCMYLYIQFQALHSTFQYAETTPFAQRSHEGKYVKTVQ